jgi:hypothetical protein
VVQVVLLEGPAALATLSDRSVLVSAHAVRRTSASSTDWAKARKARSVGCGLPGGSVVVVSAASTWSASGGAGRGGGPLAAAGPASAGRATPIPATVAATPPRRHRPPIEPPLDVVHGGGAPVDVSGQARNRLASTQVVSFDAAAAALLRRARQL